MPIAACFMLGSLIPIAGYFILRYMGKFSIHDAAATAGHYGSVSAVTFAVATQFLSSFQVKPEGICLPFWQSLNQPAAAEFCWHGSRFKRKCGNTVSRMGQRRHAPDGSSPSCTKR